MTHDLREPRTRGVHSKHGMRREEFDKAFRTYVAWARTNWLEVARSDNPERPDYVPRLVVRTKHKDHILLTPGYERGNKRSLLRRAGFSFCQEYHARPRAVFFISESWMAPATDAVNRHVQQGGSIAELTALRREVLSIAGLRPDGSGTVACLEISRTSAGETTLGEATYLPAKIGAVWVFATLGAFYEGCRLARGSKRR